MNDVIDITELGGLEDEGGNPLADPMRERQLLGVMLAHPKVIADMPSLIAAHDFWDPMHRAIYAGMIGLEGFEPTTELVMGWIGGPGTVIGGRTAKQFVGHLRGIGHDLRPEDATDLAESLFNYSERRAKGAADDARPLGEEFQSKMGMQAWSERSSPGVEPYDEIVEGVLPEKELVMIIGPTQAGKSFVARHLGYCIARGVPFMGRRIIQAMPVVWCAYEGARGVALRDLAYEKYSAFNGEMPFVSLTHPVDLWSKETNVVELIREIEGVCRSEFGGRTPGVVFIDTHNAATPGASEIDSEAVSRIRDRYRHLAFKLGCAVVIIGHTNSLGKHRGSDLLTNNVETILTVTKKTVLKNRTPEQVKDDDRRDVRSMDLIKQREGETCHLFDFVLPAIETGIKNKFGKVRTSCVVALPNWTAQAEAESNASKKPDTKAGFKLTDIEDHFFKVLWKELQESGVPAPVELGLAATVRVVHRAAVSKVYREGSIPQDGSGAVSPNTVKTRWTRSTDRLRKFGVIGYKEPFFWWTGKPILGMPATQPQRTMFDDRPEPPPSDDDYPL